MRIPTVTQCLEFFDRYRMLDNIRLHSLIVAQVAGTLIDGLVAAGRVEKRPTNRRQVIAGALLHDIAKSICLEDGRRHAEVGRQICRDLDFAEIGEIVFEHVVLSRFTPELYRRGIFGTKELVYYADKRVRHDQVVSLADRLDYIITRYGNSDPSRISFIRRNFQQTLLLEELLFQFLDFSPAELVSQLPAQTDWLEASLPGRREAPPPFAGKEGETIHQAKPLT
ncbi:MAG: HD domain-containing protein [Desulforhopalus sp.]|jgi:putative nucleotidyltransferase with HDIG domain|nr:HD domain-containing protein [Desulforhopalus sp.]